MKPNIPTLYKDLVKRFKNVYGNNNIDPSVVLGSGTKCVGTSIGAKTRIGNYTSLEYADVGRECYLGDHVTITGTRNNRVIIPDGVQLIHNAWISPSDGADLLDLGHGDYSYFVGSDGINFIHVVNDGITEHESEPITRIQNLGELRARHLNSLGIIYKQEDVDNAIINNLPWIDPLAFDIKLLFHVSQINYGFRF